MVSLVTNVQFIKRNKVQQQCCYVTIVNKVGTWHFKHYLTMTFSKKLIGFAHVQKYYMVLGD
jgi:hypothetical protein